jgi:beta-lactamase superfamily II metal-dependent hydrolase
MKSRFAVPAIGLTLTFIVAALFLILSSDRQPVVAASAVAGRETMDIYFIDVEGGAATLIVTPQGESMLVDCGWPGERDARRISEVAREQAGISQIDHYITTHWHTDHFGGIAQLVRLLPVKRYYGHGMPNPLPPDINPELVQAYRNTAGGDGLVLRPGSEITLLQRGKSAPRLRLRILAANGVVSGEKPDAAQVRPCTANHQTAQKDESDNANSVAFVLEFGSFRFFDGGDLTWNVEHKLACPANLPGKVDVFQVNHHGLDTSNNPLLVEALAPRVALVNNGAKKGGHVKTYATLKTARGIESIFQLHRNVQTGESDNAPAEMVANDNEACQGNFIKLSVDRRGKSYTVSIPAKGTTRTYTTR